MAYKHDPTFADDFDKGILAEPIVAAHLVSEGWTEVEVPKKTRHVSSPLRDLPNPTAASRAYTDRGDVLGFPPHYETDIRKVPLVAEVKRDVQAKHPNRGMWTDPVQRKLLNLGRDKIILFEKHINIDRVYWFYLTNRDMTHALRWPGPKHPLGCTPLYHRDIPVRRGGRVQHCVLVDGYRAYVVELPAPVTT